jgi:transposase
MSDTTSLLFGLDDHVVLDVQDVGPQAVRVVIEPTAGEAACPDCGVLSGRVKERPLRRIKDLPASGQRVELWCRQRRLLCAEPGCPRRSFTQTTAQIPARARTTARLRTQMAVAIARSNRPVSDVAGEHRVGWGTAHRALIAHAAGWLPAPEPTRVLEIDETRARSVRWLREDAGWKRSDPPPSAFGGGGTPRMTSFVNADPAVPGRLLGLVPGRSGACVKTWLALQDKGFRDGIEVAVIDPSAPYASGIRAALPNAAIAVDHWHLVKLANDMVTEVRLGVPPLAGEGVAGAARPPRPQDRRGVGAPSAAAHRRRPAPTPPVGATGAGARRG